MRARTFPVFKDIVKHVIDGPGKTLTKRPKMWKEIYYLRGVFNATIVAEAIRNAQKITGKKVINGEDMRKGLETLELTPERIKAAGLEGFVDSMKITCKDHAGAHRMFVQRWDGKNLEEGFRLDHADARKGPSDAGRSGSQVHCRQERLGNAEVRLIPRSAQRTWH